MNNSNRNMETSTSFIVNTSRRNYIKLKNSSSVDVINFVIRFMRENQVWNEKDNIMEIERSINYCPPFSKYHDISFSFYQLLGSQIKLKNKILKNHAISTKKQNHNMNNSNRTIETRAAFIVNTRKGNYIKLKNSSSDDVINSVIRFMKENHVWNEKDIITKIEKSINYCPPSSEYHDISFILKFYNGAKVSKEPSCPLAEVEQLVSPPPLPKQIIEKQKDQEEQIKEFNKRLDDLELKIGKTDDEKCPKCETLESALKENHSSCYKWHYNKLENPAITQLCINASENGSLDVVKFLVELGADIHALDDYAVRCASENGHLDVVKFLVEKGTNIHSLDDYTLRYASGMGHLELVKYLVSIGADIHAQNDYAVRQASIKGHLQVVKFLVTCGANIHADNDCAIRHTAENGHLEVVKFLVTSGADVNAENDYALLEALKQKNMEMIKFLVSSGANIHAVNDFALHEAMKQKNMEMISYLVSIWDND